MESLSQALDETPENTAEEMVELIMDKMRYGYGSEPMRQTQEVNKFCKFEQRWTDHETSECHLRTRHLQEQRMVNQGVAYPPKQTNQMYSQLGGREKN